jgi:hypothetical protein
LSGRSVPKGRASQKLRVPRLGRIP